MKKLLLITVLVMMLCGCSTTVDKETLNFCNTCIEKGGFCVVHDDMLATYCKIYKD